MPTSKPPIPTAQARALPAAQNTRLFLLSVLFGAIALFLIGRAVMPNAHAQGGANKPPITQAVPKPPAGREYATLAGGCFWSMEALFGQVKGVESVQSGYAGGSLAKPSYEQVCNGDTGHAESVMITFDPKVVSYQQLLTIFFNVHDPTTPNRQGADEGTQYRSAIFYHNAAQKLTVQRVILQLQKTHHFDAPIVTQVAPFSNFYPAEAYHKDYYARNASLPYCQAVIAPKLAKERDHFAPLLKR